MTTCPQILVFAGPNGSGKSTVTQLFQMVGVYVNADEIQKSLKIQDEETAQRTAAQIATATREILVANRADFTFETVLSTHNDRKCDSYLQKAWGHFGCWTF